MALKVFTYLLIILMTFTSCNLFLDKDDNLSIRREYNNKCTLRLDGYYYDHIDDKSISIFILYKNGIIRYMGTFEDYDLKKVDKILLDEELLKKAENSKFSWGVYIINKDSIYYEKWNPSEKPYKTVKYYGKIINDTTFIINTIISKDKLLKFKEIKYHFKKFDPKPDSITKFIK